MSIEQHGMKFVVDTSGVAKGFRDYRSAVEGIFSSLDQFEAHVAKTMKGVAAASNNKTALNSFKNAMNAFGSVKIDNGTVKAIGSLSAAMKDFKAPSASQTANFRKFAAALGAMPNIASAARSAKSIDELNIAMRGFKAPSVAQAKALTAFASAIGAAAPKLRAVGDLSGLSAAAGQINTLATSLGRLKAPSTAAITNLGNFALAMRSFNFGNLSGSGNFFASLAGIGTFKAPSAGQIKNLEAFIAAIGRMTIPANAQAVATHLTQIAKAAQSAQGSLSGLRVNVGSSTSAFGGFSKGAGQARLQMMGLQNAFSGTFQIGSALRTLFGSLTIGELAQGFFKATNAAQQFRAQMNVVNKSAGFAGLQLEYINQTANKFGIDALTAEGGFAKLSIAASKSGMSVLQTRSAFEGFSTGMTVLGTSAERQADVWLAVQQVLNKGYLSSEELNQQLNEQLPGAMSYASEMAKKMGMSLQDALSKKLIKGADAVQYLAQRFKEDFGPSMTAALEKPSAQMNILKNNVTTLFQKIGDSGASAAFSNLLKSFNSGLDPKTVNGFAESVGHGLADAVNKASAAFQWLRTNWDSIKGPLGTTLKLMGEWMIVSGGFKIFSALLSPVLTFSSGLRGLNSVLAGTTASAGMLSQGWAGLRAGMMPLNSGLAGLGRVGTLAAGNFTLLNSSSRVLSAGLIGANAATNVLRGGMNVVKGAASGLSAMLGGPLGIALTGLTVAAGFVGNAMMDLAANHQAAKQASADSLNVFRENSTILKDAGLSALYASIQTKDVGTSSTTASGGVAQFAGVVGTAAGQLRDMAVAARAANIETAKLALTKASNTIDTRSKDIESVARADLMRGNFTSPKDFFGRVGRKVGSAASNIWDNGQTDRDAQADVAQAIKDRDRLKQLVGKLESETPEQYTKRLHLDSQFAVAPPVGATPAKTDDKDAKKKANAAKQAFNDLQSFENAFSSLMSKLDKDDPVAKIWSDWQKTLTSTADLMLSKDGYLGAMKIIGDESTTTEQKTKALMDAISSGKLNKTALKGLKAAGYDPKDLVSSLQNALEETRQNVLEAMDKAFQKDIKGQMKSLDALGKTDETIKLSVDYGQSFNDMKTFLTPEAFRDFTPALKTYIESLRSSALDADKAKTVNDAFANALRASGAAAGLSADTIERLIGITQQNTQATLADIAAARRSQIFGADALRQRRDEIAQMMLTEQQQKVLSLTQQAISDAKQHHITVSQTMVDQFMKEAAAAERVNDALTRQKEFMENNGIRQYIGGLNDVAQAANDLDKNFLQSLEDQLTRLGTEGKFSIKSIFDSLQAGLAKMQAQEVMKGVLNFISPGASQKVANGENPSIFGGAVAKMLGQPYAPGPSVAQRTGLELGSGASNPMYVFSVNPNGDVTYGAGSAATGLASLGLPTLAANDNIGLPKAPTEQTGGATSVISAFDAQGVSKSLTNAITLGTQAAVPIITDCWGTSMTPQIENTAQQFSTSFRPAIMGMASLLGSAIGGIIGGGQSKGSKILGALISIGSSAAMAYIGGSSVTSASTARLNGAAQATIASNPGIFKEGGFTNAPVARASLTPASFANAPHYKEGTANTSGGIPAVLHDNEAVIPLSRGRKVPVEMTGGSAPSAPAEAANVHVNVHNYGDGKAKVQQSQNPDGSMNIDVIIETIEERMAGKINKGGSPINNAMERRYGVNAAQGNF